MLLLVFSLEIAVVDCGYPSVSYRVDVSHFLHPCAICFAVVVMKKRRVISVSYRSDEL